MIKTDLLLKIFFTFNANIGKNAKRICYILYDVIELRQSDARYKMSLESKTFIFFPFFELRPQDI